MCRVPLLVLTSIVRDAFLTSFEALVADPAIFLDTGIQISTDMASQIYSGVPGSQAVSGTVWSLPCNSTFSLTLTFGGKPFTMSERDTIVKSPNGTCTGVVTGGAQGLAQVGAPFMRNVYTYVVSIHWHPLWHCHIIMLY